MGMYEEIRIHRATERLMKDRDGKVPFGDFPTELVPPTLQEGYRIQESMIRRYQARGLGLGGWKMALPNQSMPQLSGAAHPVEGAVLSPFIQTAPGRVKAADYLHLCAEAGIAFRLREPLAAEKGPWDADSAGERVGSAMAAIEIADDRHSRDAPFKSLALTAADFAHNFGCVLGGEAANWREIDLAGEEIRVRLNGDAVGTATGGAALGHPLNSLVWLANRLNARGLRVEAGDIVLTGCVTQMIWLSAGEELVVETANLAPATLTVTT